MQATVKQELIVRLVFSIPLRRNKLSTLDRYRCCSAEVQCVKMRWMRKTPKRRRRRVEDHRGRKREKRTRRRRISRRKTRQKEREQKAANKKCVSTRWKVKPSEGFFLSMPLTQKALTYQTRAHWALCPLITDFLQAADGGIGLLCFCSLAGADKSFSDHCGCMRERRHYEDIVFLFTEIVTNTRRKGPQRGNKRDAVREGNKNTTAEHKY